MKIKSKKCKKCFKEHNGQYGSGIFCSEYCARSYATFKKRKIINKKISFLARKKHPDHFGIKIVCRYCSKIKDVSYNRRNQQFCSNSCSSHVNGYIGGRSKKPGNGGLREGGGHTKLHTYISPYAGRLKLNNHEIIVAQILDKIRLPWIRNKRGFSYIDLNKHLRNYYPDFYIKRYDYYIEYKGWITNETQHKMNDALKRNQFKLLIIYSNDKRYRNLGLNLETIQNNSNKLIEALI